MTLIELESRPAGIPPGTAAAEVAATDVVALRRLVDAVQRKGVRVTVVSTIRSSPPMIADELRRQADVFLELQELAPSIMRVHHRDDNPRAPAMAPGDNAS